MKHWIQLGKETVGGQTVHMLPAIRHIYAGTAFQPVWQNEKGKRLLKQLTVVLSQTSRHGLLKEDYHFDYLTSADDQTDPLALELLATDAFLLYAYHMAHGKANPNRLRADWRLQQTHQDIIAFFERAVHNENVAVSLHHLVPDRPDYDLLMQAMAKTLQQETIILPAVPGEAFREGDQDTIIPKIRAALVREGDLRQMQAKESMLFDENVKKAVKRFQRRHGLKADGVIGSDTMDYLNMPKRLKHLKLAVNMERLRWLPRKPGPHYLMVNVPGFYVDVVEKNTAIKRIPVIVGKPQRPTPVFSAPMTYFVVNPYWYVPYNIAKEDVWPHAMGNPGYLKRQHFEVIGPSGRVLSLNRLPWQDIQHDLSKFRLRQKPGSLNSLGKIKFIFPNPYGIYLHDTPEQKYFKQRIRAESSGCIRVADPSWLMHWLARFQTHYTTAKLDAFWHNAASKKIDLDEEIPVYITYRTVWSDDGTRLQWRKDIYERDNPLAVQLFRRQDGGIPARLY